MAERYSFASDKGRRRSTNQDRALAREIEGGFTLLIVADGVGGAAGGEVASAETVTEMVRALTGAPVTDPPKDLWRAVTLANGRVRDVSQTDPHLSGMATTLVAALIRQNDAWIVSLGDSRAYLVRDRDIQTLTEDDSWLAEQVRAGTISPEDAERSPYQNVITRGIGVEERLKVEEPGHLRLRDGDQLLLCSDGLYRCVTPETMAETLLGLGPSEASARLIELANRAGGPDNISVAIYRHEDPQTAPTVAMD